ncbi:MAG: DUF4389 domain-containing protein [Dehalococcoidia bacterium]|nr:DUF4389 domain-containing protein [Dehalococcoidia bacterium]
MGRITPFGSDSLGAKAAYPVVFAVERPPRFDRAQIFLRLAIALLFSLLLAVIWLIALVYFAIPVLAAAFTSRDGPDRFFDENAPRLKRWLHWLVAFGAYGALLTDRIPLDDPESVVRLEVRPSGRPTTGRALLRLVLSVPSAVALAALSAVAVVTWTVAAVMVLVDENYGGWLYAFHTGLVAWGARLLCYHASLTDRYPPFSLAANPAA